MRKFIFLGVLVAFALLAMGPQINTSGRCSSGQNCSVGGGVASSFTIDTDGSSGDSEFIVPDVTFEANGDWISNAEADSQFTFEIDEDSTVVLAPGDTTDANTPLTVRSAGTGALLIDGGGASAITVGSADVTTINLTNTGDLTVGATSSDSVILISDNDVQIQNGATGIVSLDFRDYADTTDDDMAHGLITSNCTTATTGAEECDMNVSITTAGANIEVLAIDPAGGIEYGDATTTGHTFTSDGLNGAVVLDGSVLAQIPTVSQAAGAIVMNTVTLATAAGDYTIADTECDATADIGNWFTIIIEDVSTVVVINPLDAADVLFIDGVVIAAGDEADSNSTAAYAGAHLTMVCMAVNQWYSTSATRDQDGTNFWIDGGSS